MRMMMNKPSKCANGDAPVGTFFSFLCPEIMIKLCCMWKGEGSTMKLYVKLGKGLQNIWEKKK